MFIYMIANKMPCHIVTISHLGAFNKSTHFAFKILCVSRRDGAMAATSASLFREMINHKARRDFSRGRLPAFCFPKTQNKPHKNFKYSF